MKKKKKKKNKVTNKFISFEKVTTATPSEPILKREEQRSIDKTA